MDENTFSEQNRSVVKLIRISVEKAGVFYPRPFWSKIFCQEKEVEEGWVELGKKLGSVVGQFHNCQGVLL